MIGSVVISVSLTVIVIVGVALWQLESSTNIEEAVRLLGSLVEALK